MTSIEKGKMGSKNGTISANSKIDVNIGFTSAPATTLAPVATPFLLVAFTVPTMSVLAVIVPTPSTVLVQPIFINIQSATGKSYTVAVGGNGETCIPMTAQGSKFMLVRDTYTV